MSKKLSAYLKEENLLTLLSQNNFIVPEIQREYVWGENEKVIIKFLDDLKSKIGVCCNSCNLPSSENKINIGFLYSYKPDYVKIEHDRFLDENLIDGQQRFTTLFLLLFYCSLKEVRADGKNRKDEFLTLVRFEEKISMCFDYKVRDLTKRFMLELLEKINSIEELKNIAQQTWFLRDYKNDVSINSMRKALDFIESVFSDNTRYYNHLINYVVFWHFKTEATSQGEELYITMNARGEELADNEVTKAALMIGGSEILEWGKKWEEWQQFFWKNRDKTDINPSADKGFNSFLSCIAGLEFYLFDKEGIAIEKDIQKLLTLDKVEKYFNAFKFLIEHHSEFTSHYSYSSWIPKCVNEIWGIFNKNETDWFANYQDKNKSTERNRMVFIWSWFYYINRVNDTGKEVVIDELYRVLRFFYIRYNNFNRSVSTLKETVKWIIDNGIWDTLGNEIELETENTEDETDTKFRTTEETIKNKLLHDNIDNPDLCKLEEIIWEIEDHPLNLDGSDVGNINITHLIELNGSIDYETLIQVRNTFYSMFPAKSASATLKTILLYYFDFSNKKGYRNGTKYNFSDWKRNIRNVEIRQLILALIKNKPNEHLEYLKKEFIEKYKDEITNSISVLPKGFSFIEKLIFYSLILSPEGLWKFGSIMIEYSSIENPRLFEDEDKRICNLKSDFRSDSMDLWVEVCKHFENPLAEIKNKIVQ